MPLFEDIDVSDSAPNKQARLVGGYGVYLVRSKRNPIDKLFLRWNQSFWMWEFPQISITEVARNITLEKTGTTHFNYVGRWRGAKVLEVSANRGSGILRKFLQKFWIRFNHFDASFKNGSPLACFD